jgi:hypothetical protein
MFYERGCHGRIVVGRLAGDLATRLAALPGEWLEFDAASGSIVVRHIQPTSAPSLPTITAELVRMLSEIPLTLHAGIEGGELVIRTEDSPHLVRLGVTRGGGVRLDWAHADFARSRKLPYTDGGEIPIDAVYSRLNGIVSFRARDAAGAARALQRMADTYEGLYPEGDFRASAGGPAGAVEITLREVNLDPRLLVSRVRELAVSGTANGRIEVGSFDDRHPDELVRLVFQDGAVWVEEPILWADPAAPR